MKGQVGRDIFTHNPVGDLRGFRSSKEDHLKEMPLSLVSCERFQPN